LQPLDALAIVAYFGRRGTTMATMISEVYDAFIASGTPEDKARKAAEAMAAYDGRFNGIEHDLGLIRGDINIVRGDINTVRGEISLLKWMNGITWALCFGIIFKLFLR
jgi:hypothetical protein